MIITQWDFKTEGIICPVCLGKNKIYKHRDMHTSGGDIPCPARYFHGHGFPTCTGGKLRFSKYDKDNKDTLMADKNLKYEPRRYAWDM